MRGRTVSYKGQKGRRTRATQDSYWQQPMGDEDLFLILVIRSRDRVSSRFVKFANKLRA